MRSFGVTTAVAVAALIACGSAAGVAGAATTPEPKTETATLGAVTATFTWRPAS